MRPRVQRFDQPYESVGLKRVCNLSSLSCFNMCRDVHAQLSVFAVEHVLAHSGRNVRSEEKVLRGFMSIQEF